MLVKYYKAKLIYHLRSKAENSLIKTDSSKYLCLKHLVKIK